MRKLERDLISFPVEFTGETRVNWQFDLLEQDRNRRQTNDPTKKLDFKPSRWGLAKDNLKLESKEKCAYCEVNFTTVAYGDVEHFRPKSIYWWLAYAYFNYSASCQLCNQKYKRAIFNVSNNAMSAPRIRRNSTDNYLRNLAPTIAPDPMDDSLGLSFDTFRQLHINERPLAVDPYVDDPTDYFKYEFNDTTKEVFIGPIEDRTNDIAVESIKLFGLNRKELKVDRYKGLLLYRIMREFIESPNSDRRMKDISQIGMDSLLNVNAEYTAMYQYFHKLPLVLIPLSV